MGLTYQESIESFTPSKTFLGKLISQDFIENITTSLVGIDSEEDLKKLL